MTADRVMLLVLFAWCLLNQWQVGTLAATVARLRREIERNKRQD